MGTGPRADRGPRPSRPVAPDSRQLARQRRRAHPPGTPAHVRIGVEGDAAVLRVRDRGPGLRDADLGKVFERFHGAGTGSGLGLAIVAAIAQAHGGSVAVCNPEGGGAEFTVRIPVVPAIHGRATQK
ncbi:sensor histidine kinase [Actinokineospora soli]|uniref:histidine kinase n=1 Tax=Actinokineospora soli TaxID=1048753 RepID=A0ABW2TUB4_9PSEU